MNFRKFGDRDTKISLNCQNLKIELANTLRSSKISCTTPLSCFIIKGWRVIKIDYLLVSLLSRIKAASSDLIL